MQRIEETSSGDEGASGASEHRSTTRKLLRSSVNELLKGRVLPKQCVLCHKGVRRYKAKRGGKSMRENLTRTETLHGGRLEDGSETQNITCNAYAHMGHNDTSNDLF